MGKELIVFGIVFGIGYFFGFYNGFLNNSVVKPSERRSPTDESFSGCKPPDERQNPQEDLICPSCKKEKGALENCYLDSKCCVCTLKDKLKNLKACK